ncbi:MAG: LysE family transporter [Candidatus Saelkia tenebricola]|nr:LysE family transporter [Candidatus Saelkia tenebricola]
MDYLSIFIVSFTIALSGALVPGPLLATVIYQSTKHGFKTGPLIILGHAILEIAMVIIIVLGLNRFIDNALTTKTISLLGTFILLIFGLNILCNLPSMSLDLQTKQKKSSNLTLLGITMSIANPYWTIWWLTIGLGFVLSAQKTGFVALGVFFLGHITADLGWYSIVSFTISKGRNLLSDKIYKAILCACAIILIGFAIYFSLGIFN